MSKHRAVDAAILALIAGALPGCRVRETDGSEAKPDRVSPTGEVIVGEADPGSPDIDLSPPTWNWDRRVPVELAAFSSGTLSPREAIDAMLAAIDAAIEVDRTLGGLCTWLDAEAPIGGTADQRGAQPVTWSDFAIVASYSTLSALG